MSKKKNVKCENCVHFNTAIAKNNYSLSAAGHCNLTGLLSFKGDTCTSSLDNRIDFDKLTAPKKEVQQITLF